MDHLLDCWWNGRAERLKIHTFAQRVPAGEERNLSLPMLAAARRKRCPQVAKPWGGGGTVPGVSRMRKLSSS